MSRMKQTHTPILESVLRIIYPCSPLLCSVPSDSNYFDLTETTGEQFQEKTEEAAATRGNGELVWGSS